MYLETLLDNGILGSLPIIVFWGIMIMYAGRLFRSNNRVCSASGGLALSLILSQAIAGMGSQHVYPEAGTLGMWLATFLLLRAHVEWTRERKDVVNTENLWNRQEFQPQQATIADARTQGITIR